MKPRSALWILLTLLTVLLLPVPSAAGPGVWTRCSTGIPGADVRSFGASPAYASDQQLFVAATGGGVYRTTNGGTLWEPRSAGLTADLTEIAVSPAFPNDGTLFVGGTTGIWRSSTAGASWVKLTGFSGSANHLALSPNYAADGTLLVGNYNGVSRSTNRGDSFGATTGLPASIVYSVALSPGFASDRTAFAGSAGGLFRSTNGGESWSAVDISGAPVTVYALALSPSFASDRTGFAASWGRGMLKTTNGGDTWVPLSDTVTTARCSFVTASPNYAVDRTLLGMGNTAGIVRSTDGGTTWSKFNTGLPGCTVNTLYFSPAYASDKTAYVGTSGGVFASVDGAVWIFRTAGLAAPDISSVVVSPNYAVDHTVIAGTASAGVYRSTDSAVTWNPKNTNLSDISITSLGISPVFGSDHVLFAGTLNGAFRSGNSGDSWALVKGGWAVRSIVLSNQYATRPHVILGGWNVQYSENGGGSWNQPSSYGILANVRGLAYQRWGNNQGDGAGLAATDKGVYKCEWPNSWHLANNGLTDVSLYCVVMAPSFNLNHTAFVGSFGAGVFKTTNEGGTWTPVDPSSTKTIYSLAISPGWTTDRTIAAGDYGNVMLSTDGGTTWTPIKAGLPSTTIRSLAITNSSPKVIYAATPQGVYQFTLLAWSDYKHIFIPVTRK